jgi:hypothetical protein
VTPTPVHGQQWPDDAERLLVALEARTDIWGPDHPCLILVKPLSHP